MSEASTSTGLENCQLRLNTLENSRQSLGRIIRMYSRGELDAVPYRNLCYGFSHYLSYWKVELDARIEERLDAIEDALLTGGKG